MQEATYCAKTKPRLHAFSAKGENLLQPQIHVYICILEYKVSINFSISSLNTMKDTLFLVLQIFLSQSALKQVHSAGK